MNRVHGLAEMRVSKGFARIEGTHLPSRDKRRKELR